MIQGIYFPFKTGKVRQEQEPMSRKKPAANNVGVDVLNWSDLAEERALHPRIHPYRIRKNY